MVRHRSDEIRRTFTEVVTFTLAPSSILALMRSVAARHTPARRCGAGVRRPPSAGAQPREVTVEQAKCDMFSRILGSRVLGCGLYAYVGDGEVWQRWRCAEVVLHCCGFFWVRRVVPIRINSVRPTTGRVQVPVIVVQNHISRTHACGFRLYSVDRKQVQVRSIVMDVLKQFSLVQYI
jgi:hypothetical protein